MCKKPDRWDCKSNFISMKFLLLPTAYKFRRNDVRGAFYFKKTVDQDENTKRAFGYALFFIANFMKS